MRVMWRVFSYMRAHWLSEAFAYLCMLGITAISVYRPQLIRDVVDLGIEKNQPNVLAQSVLLLLILTLIQGFMRFGQRYLTEKVSQGIAYDMRNQAYRKLQSLSFSYHDRTQTGQLLSRVTSDVERLRGMTGMGIVSLIDAIVLVAATAVILFRMHALLAALSMLVMPVILIIMRNFIEHIHPLWHLRQDQVGELTIRLEQNLRGVSVVRGFAQEPAEIGRFDRQNDTIYDTSMTIARAGALNMPLVVFLASLASVLILWLGGRLVISGQLSIGELVAFNSYLLQLFGPIRRLGMLVNMLAESRASAERVFDIFDASSEVEDAPDAVEMANIQGEVKFDHVSFAYIGGEQVLSDLSFQVHPGQVVALLGPTGSGKSTVTNLIPRFYDAAHGTITIDGIDIRSVKQESLRKQIGIVLQETTLFGSTIRENITFGRPDATQEEIEAAAKAAAAHDFIMAMPDGYDTAVGERGVTLSGGQRQRIAIARALLLNPRILILDDATSSVDTETEQLIQQALDKLMRGRTSFVIAQRVSTVRNADVILVIDRGKLVAQGRHSDLIRESGIYADIYYRQLRPEDGESQPAIVGG
ncbi:MAG: hypothetical protein A2Y73_05005 [Chloroflexi bacterium RBG_13_56_8]|nr:MAG: hypothetical protein A2Y73_05005 [Chloroflexi bacterium RBG_13_56_8]